MHNYLEKNKGLTINKQIFAFVFIVCVCVGVCGGRRMYV